MLALNPATPHPMLLTLTACPPTVESVKAEKIEGPGCADRPESRVMGRWFLEAGYYQRVDRIEARDEDQEILGRKDSAD